MESKDILISLVEEIQNAYTRIEELWTEYAESNNLALFNQKSVRIRECVKNQSYLELITEYLVFLTSNKIDQGYHRVGEKYVVDSRIKARNSVEEKMDDYVKTGQDFNVNKCLNDLFGIRIILDDIFSHEEILDIFKDNNCLKCIDSSKPKDTNPKVYTATHIYFKGMGNTHFQWELQIWMARDEVANQKSHKGHRFIYTKWEKVRE